MRREAHKQILPSYAAVDIHVLLRLAMRTYDLLHYLNADVRRETDTDWRQAYTIVTLPSIRTMIDCLYNITAILQEPRTNAPWFRKSGFRRALLALDEDQDRYGGQKKWDDWINSRRELLDLSMRAISMSEAEVMAQREPWPTLGTYAKPKPSGDPLTPHQQFLRTFTFGYWREYSAIAHGSFDGLLPAAPYYISDSFMLEEREKLEELHINVLSEHLPRAAVILLCIVTELPAYFRFEGANINKTLHAVWRALLPAFDAKELYDERYAKLMEEQGLEDW